MFDECVKHSDIHFNQLKEVGFCVMHMSACLYLLSIKRTEEREGDEFESESNEGCAQNYNEDVK